MTTLHIDDLKTPRVLQIDEMTELDLNKLELVDENTLPLVTKHSQLLSTTKVQ